VLKVVLRVLIMVGMTDDRLVETKASQLVDLKVVLKGI